MSPENPRPKMRAAVDADAVSLASHRGIRKADALRIVAGTYAENLASSTDARDRDYWRLMCEVADEAVASSLANEEHDARYTP